MTSVTRTGGAIFSAMVGLSSCTVALAPWGRSGVGGAPTTPVHPQRCGAANTRITEGVGTVGAGTYSLLVEVTNTSGADCTINGYPAVGLLDSSGASIRSAIDTRDGPLDSLPAPRSPSPLTLTPRQTASALVGGTDMPVGTETTCPSYSLAVQLPGSSLPIHLPRRVAGCSHVLVGPFVTGFNGTAPTGEIAGAAPRCPGGASGPPSGPVETVAVTALSGSRVMGAVTVSPGRRYDLVMAAGPARVTSNGGLTRRVVVHVGRITQLGTFGRCTAVPGPPPTTVPRSGGSGWSPATTSTTPTTSAAAAPAFAECTNDQIWIAGFRFGQAGGSASELIVFQNSGAAPCSLSGFPGVAVLNRSGEQVEQAVRVRVAMMGGFDGPQLSSVDLAPGEEASATVEASDNPVAPAVSCPYYPAFLVTAPDETRSVTLAAVGEEGPGFANAGFPGCSRIVVTPVVPGNTGSYP